MKIRCISLWQPWASLMANGAKILETRGWDTAVRGETYIHASKTVAGIRQFVAGDVPLWQLRAIEVALSLGVEHWADALPRGAILARADLRETFSAEVGAARFPGQRPFGDFDHGRFCHRYAGIRPLKTPLPCRGAQGFFYRELLTPNLLDPYDHE